MTINNVVVTIKTKPPAPPVSGLYEHIGYWHNRFGRQVGTSFERRLAAHGMTVSQWCLLIAVFHEQADTVRDIARIIQLDPGAVTRLATRLEEKHLLKRIPDPSDARSVRIALTPGGKKLIPRLAAEADLNDEQFYGILNNAEIVQFKTLLTKLLRTAGNEICPAWPYAPFKRPSKPKTKSK